MKHYILSTVLIAIIVFGIWKVVVKKDTSQEVLSSESNTVVALDPDTDLIFTDPEGKFSFGYISPYEITRVEDGVYEAFLIQIDGSGIQVYVTDFVDSGVFNAARVKKEVVGSLQNLQDIEMPGGFPAVTFSTKTAQGDEWDVWFVAGERLYQITADPGTDTLLKKVVESWRFE